MGDENSNEYCLVSVCRPSLCPLCNVHSCCTLSPPLIESAIGVGRPFPLLCCPYAGAETLARDRVTLSGALAPCGTSRNACACLPRLSIRVNRGIENLHLRAVTSMLRMAGGVGGKPFNAPRWPTKLGIVCKCPVRLTSVQYQGLPILSHALSQIPGMNQCFTLKLLINSLKA